ncbi:hypothetical protein SDC9_191000 [bioreactor metagenome]|uniref:Uncharacterized protein n=1 Tax=bioreactor metagenome TaxID=1076179 RepID=A0A645HX47_9ZZZZ
MEKEGPVLTDQARANGLAAAAYSCHEVALNQAGKDLEVCLHVQAVDLHLTAALSPAQIGQVLFILAIMVDDLDVVGKYPGIDDFLNLFSCHRPVCSGGNEHLQVRRTIPDRE